MTLVPPNIIAILLLLGLIGTPAYVFLRRLQRDRFIRDYRFSPDLLHRLRQRNPALSEDQAALVARALKQYFRVALRTNLGYIAMPSRLADDLWHDFILSTRAYQNFCVNAFGQYLHHHPNAARPRSDDSYTGMCRIWWYSTRLEQLDPNHSDRLPLIFALDAMLGDKDGHHYRPNDPKLAGLLGQKPGQQGRRRSPYVDGHAGASCGGGDLSDAGGEGCGGSGCGGGD